MTLKKNINNELEKLKEAEDKINNLEYLYDFNDLNEEFSNSIINELRFWNNIIKEIKKYLWHISPNYRNNLISEPDSIYMIF